MQKNTLALWALTLLSLLFFTYSCKKDSNNSGTPTTTSITSATSAAVPGSFKCKINGDPFEADSTIADFHSNGMTINAFRNDTFVMSLIVNKPIIGNHTLDRDSNLAYYDTEAILFICHNGNINITAANEANRTAAGTFNFRDKQSVSESNFVITDGSFNIKK